MYFLGFENSRILVVNTLNETDGIMAMDTGYSCSQMIGKNFHMKAFLR